MNSIRRRLLIWLVLGLTACMVVGSWAVYSRARSQAREIFDFQLQQMASAFPGKVFGKSAPDPTQDVTLTDVVLRIWDENGTQIYASHRASGAPRAEAFGFTSMTTDRGSWRVYSTMVGDNVVQIAQSTSVRERLATDMALRAMLPLLALFPALMALVWVTVGRGLKPLDEIAEAMHAQSVDDLKPLPENTVPQEVKPLVLALNAMLARLDRAMRLQRSFIADAAHELRTPLTAVMLQLQLAERARTEEDRRRELAKLKGGIERATHLVKQLLTLARAEPEGATRAPEAVDLAEIAREVVAEQAAIAEAKGIDLGLSSQASVPVQGYPNSLRILLGNLVDNAIRYTPGGGRIDVDAALEKNQPRLLVRDTGRGIPHEDRQRVFDRFYRQDGGDTNTTGSGLGLAIVQKLAQRHHAAVELGDGADGRGLTVTVRFPRAA